MNLLNDSVILITGGTGSWGNELTKQLLSEHSPREVRIYSRGEHEQVKMRRKFKDERLKYFIGDVRDKDRLLLATKNVDYVFHLAALKHVPVCEEHPWEAVKTNIIGTQNLIECSIMNQVKKVIDVSTDKAVAPLNLYGVTKACGEKLIIAANLISDHTKFVCIRGGNVLGTRGSVVPLFKEQIKKLNEITLTDDKMTRFFMRVEEAIKLVLKAAIDSYGGEVFVMKTPAAKIIDLAKVMIDELADGVVNIKFIGVRPGEKLHEVLVSKHEAVNTYDIGDYFVIMPQIKLKEMGKYELLNFKKVSFKEYSSNSKHMTITEIKELLDKDKCFDEYLESLDNKDLGNFAASEDWTPRRETK